MSESDGQWKTGVDLCRTCGAREKCRFYLEQVRVQGVHVTACAHWLPQPDEEE